MRRYDDVLELLPSVLSSFEKLGMRREAAKSRFLEAMTLKETGRNVEAFAAFETLRTRLEGTIEKSLLGMVLIEIGSQYSEQSRYDEAVAEYQKAMAVLSSTGEPMTIAHLKGIVGDTYRHQGNLSAAIEAFSSALADYVSLGMTVRVAYYRVILAETLIAVSRHREAEWQILAALPTIEEQKMVPEGFAAVALLRESVRMRKTDPKALRELREHLQVE
jgi:tetratricopeptide (TPR) repeat protein